MDDAPIYNSSHVFGFFSVFNPDAVRDVKLIKGGIPATYGGRLSSVLDVRLKEGNNKRLSVKGGVGIIFSRLSVEAPIKKDKGSFIVAARRSYGDVFLRLSPTFKNTTIYFYDLTGKANYTITDRDRVFLSGYLGRDVFSTSNGSAGFGFNWGNTTATARWNHLFSSRLFLNTTAYFSQYDYRLYATAGTGGFDWKAGIANSSIKPELTWYPNPDNQVTAGAQAIYYDANQGAFLATSSDGTPAGTSVPHQYGNENALFLANEQTVSSRFTLQYGLRYSMFNYLGKGTAYNYNESTLNAVHPVTDSSIYSSGQVIKSYSVPEPRLALKYELTDKSSFKASYNRMAQYVHLISSTTAATPIDIWVLSTNNVKPEIADQVAAGYFRNFGENNGWEASVEVYYKTMQNQIDYVDHAQLLVNKKLEGSLLYGKGRAYGAEFFLKKTTGKLTGWISYTLSKTERQVQGVSNNDWYAAKQDRPNNLNTVINYELNKKWSFSSNVVYITGTPMTFDTQKIPFDGQAQAVGNNPGSVRNSYRVPATFRIDLSATLQLHRRNPDKWNKNYESSLVFSVYNVLARRNAFGIYMQPTDADPRKFEAVKYSIFGTAIPGITYNFTF